VVVKILYYDFYDFWWGNGLAGSVVLPARWWNTLIVFLNIALSVRIRGSYYTTESRCFNLL